MFYSKINSPIAYGSASFRKLEMLKIDLFNLLVSDSSRILFQIKVWNFKLKVFSITPHENLLEFQCLFHRTDQTQHR